MSCGSGSGLGSTQYTKHQHHAEPNFCAAVVFYGLIFYSQWCYGCGFVIKRAIHVCEGWHMRVEAGGAQYFLRYIGTVAECGTKDAMGNLGPWRFVQK